MITSFTGQYRFLSNFWPCSIQFDGYIYASVEHAYQAAKTDNLDLRELIRELTAGKAKNIGRSILLSEDWNDRKYDIMYHLVTQKFFNVMLLRESLLATGDQQLVEGNNWGDIYWGVCNGQGENNLGKILMQVRSELRNKDIEI